MRHNMGKIEKLVRLSLGVVLFLVGRYLGAFGVFGAVVTGSVLSGFVVALVGVVIFVTGVISYCPINSLLRVNSCEACRIGETHKHLPV